MVVTTYPTHRARISLELEEVERKLIMETKRAREESTDYLEGYVDSYEQTRNPLSNLFRFFFGEPVRYIVRKRVLEERLTENSQ